MVSQMFPIVLACVVLSVASSSWAGTIRVRQDGTGDFTNIIAAVAAAAPNDSIAVGPGTYHEGNMIEINIPLVLYSFDGPEVTILDGGTVHRILNLRGADVKVAGFSLVDGQGAGICAVTCGGAVLVWQGAHAVLEDCVFVNSVGEKGGAFYVTDSNLGLGTSATVRRSRFTGGTSITAGSAAYVVLGASATFEECVFDNNTTGITGTIDVYYSHAIIRNSLFKDNMTNDVAGAVVYYQSTGNVEGNTFVDNTSPGGIAATVLLHESGAVSFRRNIVAGETQGYGLYYLGPIGAHGCNVFWNNAAGALAGAPLAADEIVADPIFCDPAAVNYSLGDISPAAPAVSACGQLIGAFPVACHLPQPGAPVILSILDIPGDNGGQVRIRWQRSQYDARGQSPTITEYGIYRQQPPGLAVQPVSSKPRFRGVDFGAGGSLTAVPRTPHIELDGWDFVAVVPARGDDIYQYVAPTLCDAPVHGDPCWSVFFVSAMTSDPFTYFDSEPDSGVSQDNLPPHSPRGLVVDYAVGSGNALTWSPAEDGDFHSFRVYRGTDPGFEPGSESLVHETTESQWVDPQHGWGVHYKLTATDDSGNESPATVPGTVTDTREAVVPAHYDLYAAVPNPFNPRTMIAYDVPSGGGRVRLRIYDATGKLVRTLVDREEAEGKHQVGWDGTSNDGQRLASGTYFYSLQGRGFERTLKMTLLQ